MSRPFPEDRRVRLDHNQSYAPGRREFFFTGVANPALRISATPPPGPICSSCNKSIICDAIQIVCPSCQRHFHKICSHLIRSQKGIQGLSVCSVRRVLLHCHLRRPSQAPAYYHANVYSLTLRFDSTSIQMCIISIPASHTINVLTSLVT